MSFRQCIRRVVSLVRSSRSTRTEPQEWRICSQGSHELRPLTSQPPSPSHAFPTPGSFLLDRPATRTYNTVELSSSPQTRLSHSLAQEWAHTHSRGPPQLANLDIEWNVGVRNIDFQATRSFAGGSNGSITSRFKADQEKIRARQKARAALLSARYPESYEDPPPPPSPPSVVEAPGLLYNTQVDMSGIELYESAPPPTQRLVGPLKPSNEAERMLANLVARPDLVIERKIEWANLMVGMEQQNRYLVTDLHKGVNVGTILETSNWISRQFLRTHRPFVATIYDATGRELCRIRRPFYVITSEVFVEVGCEQVGHVKQRWHLWKRKYDLYKGKDQFAEVVNGGLWFWTFNLLNFDGNDVAVIDRNWRGLGLEFFTDAGQYVVRFGDTSYGNEASQVPVGGEERLRESDSGYAADRRTVESAQRVPDFEPARPLDLMERAITLSLAVALDVDYFSRHSEGGGFMTLPFIFGGGSSDS